MLLVRVTLPNAERAAKIEMQLESITSVARIMWGAYDILNCPESAFSVISIQAEKFYARNIKSKGTVQSY